ncbi:MAG TPA: methylmalonyl Co-A mutase-associated GTPase MeaB [Candidatus Nanopelagicaceae bacterium]|nr:methylmalonyl Co-A mutase-associated GTPase MeaB [Candidatus Nanopelagicaceae bacterium]
MILGKIEELVDRARHHDTRAIAQLISLVEDGAQELRQVLRLLAPNTGHAHIVGITGAPGVGKSTTTSALISEYRKRGLRVAVLAVDPSSPFSGGAVLGDRIRMQEHALDANVFIRSMASRGQLGGLSAAAPQGIRILDAAGFDVVIVETVGVGQSEVEIAGHADTTVVLLAPGMGDGIQAAKAGLLEIGDLYVINKADRDGAKTTARELRHSLAMSHPSDGRDREIILTSADRGEGIAEIVKAVDAHLDWLKDSGDLGRRRARRITMEIEHLAIAALRQKMILQAHDIDGLTLEVAEGRMDTYQAADNLLEIFGRMKP